jgi:hypothetical protein
MGNSGNVDRRVGIVRLGPHNRHRYLGVAKVASLLIEVERHHQSNIERQHRYRAKKNAFKEVANAPNTT